MYLILKFALNWSKKFVITTESLWSRIFMHIFHNKNTRKNTNFFLKFLTKSCYAHCQPWLRWVIIIISIGTFVKNILSDAVSSTAVEQDARLLQDKKEMLISFNKHFLWPWETWESEFHRKKRIHLAIHNFILALVWIKSSKNKSNQHSRNSDANNGEISLNTQQTLEAFVWTINHLWNSLTESGFRFP